MELMKRNARLAFFGAFMVAVLLTGCSGDDSTTTTEPGKRGTITIDQTPDDLTGAGWLLTGPQDEAGSGDTTLTDMPVGSYTLTWNAVSGYITPSGETKTLASGGTIAFSKTYVLDAGPAGEFVLIPAGTFSMGSPPDEPSRDIDETQHTVILTRSFNMWSIEVTNQQYAELAQWAYDNNHCTVTGTSLLDNLDGSTQVLVDFNKSEISFSGDTFTVEEGKQYHPMKAVTWYGAARHCDWLSLRAGYQRAYQHSGDWSCNNGDPYAATGYRLPTEAEWEYACRAGTQTPFNTGDCLDAGTEANYNGSFPYTGCPSGPLVGWTTPAGTYPPNAFALYDMHGNVYEWCDDWYGAYSGDETDPVGQATGSERILRGGYWNYYALGCRSAYRVDTNPDNCQRSFGFRPVRTSN